ncbi:MAG: glycosyltransferase [Bacteroidales bacterium]|jgi:glycosyltransferase involved in cell wall biosynthesis|nr:glycosyltransferase [Bacteroidales bacterium]
MKGLFIHFFGLKEFSGISKKIVSQIEALRLSGIEMLFCYMEIDSEGNQRRVCDNIRIDDFGNGLFSKFGKWICFKNLTNYIIKNNIGFVYIRSFYNCNPFMLRMFDKLREKGIKIVLEYPTYPYDIETSKEHFKYKPIFFLNRLFRKGLKGKIDGIVTFTNLDKIEGVRTVKISNAIDFKSVGLSQRGDNNSAIFNLLGVAEIHFWHGFDRVITGLADYYRSDNFTKEVHFHIVGDGCEKDNLELKVLTNKLGMNQYVHFHGNRRSDELDSFFDMADFGIASLARHRTGITYIKTLKNREYAARGLAFAYSEIDEDFENMPYILKIAPNESPVNICEILHFCQDMKLSPQEIRKSIEEKLSWEVQMKKVVDVIIGNND